MNILEQIIGHKKVEVAERRKALNESILRESPFFSRPVFSLRGFLQDETRNGIIAEFKRCSPSKGVINASAEVRKVTAAYAANGASALSILTDNDFFGGSTGDLCQARFNEIPILRKDFIIDEYQLVEARAMGADVILLIAACLEPMRVEELAKFAKELGLEVLLELHDEKELDHVCDATDIVGINNRDLKTFQVDVERSLRMAAAIGADKLKVAESGINSPEHVRMFRDHGFHGFLIGEHFMKEADPAAAFEKFANELRAE